MHKNVKIETKQFYTSIVEEMIFRPTMVYLKNLGYSDITV